MPFKDYFSQQSAQYAQFRPRYPEDLFVWLAGIAPHHAIAWDCATGNGQVALSLTPYFEQIIATDASEAQISHAFPHPKISYGVAPAEKTAIPPQSLDLITVAQAIHWFRIEDFYKEVRRVLKPTGILAIFGYGQFTILNGSRKGLELLEQLTSIVEPYWPQEIQLIRDGYQTLDFPFTEIPTPEFSLAKTLEAEQLVGYFSSWSATQKLREAKGDIFVDSLLSDLLQGLETMQETVRLHWPIYLRVGKLYE